MHDERVRSNELSGIDFAMTLVDQLSHRSVSRSLPIGVAKCRGTDSSPNAEFIRLATFKKAITAQTQ